MINFPKTLRFGVPKTDFLKMLHWNPFLAFYQELLNLAGHILF